MGRRSCRYPAIPFLSQGLTFPKLSLGNVTARIVFEQGPRHLSDVRSQSGDAEISLEGYVELPRSPPLSELHLYHAFVPRRLLLKRRPRWRSSPAPWPPANSDGSLGFALGTVGNPRSRGRQNPPDGSASTVARGCRWAPALLGPTSSAARGCRAATGP